MLYFFFQAEDGIRGYKVTGVQTCALPILVVIGRSPLTLSGNETAAQVVAPTGRPRAAGRRRSRDREHQARPHAIFAVLRSEERRVGKERRARETPDTHKTKTDTLARCTPY